MNLSRGRTSVFLFLYIVMNLRFLLARKLNFGIDKFS